MVSAFFSRQPPSLPDFKSFADLLYQGVHVLIGQVLFRYLSGPTKMLIVRTTSEPYPLGALNFTPWLRL